MKIVLPEAGTAKYKHYWFIYTSPKFIAAKKLMGMERYDSRGPGFHKSAGPPEGFEGRNLAFEGIYLEDHPN